MALFDSRNAARADTLDGGGAALENTRIFAVVRTRGGAWEPGTGLEQQAGWRGHAVFMKALHREGFVVLVGPLEGTPDVLLIVRATTSQEIETRLAEDPNIPVSNLETLDKQQQESLITERLVAALSAGFGMLATLLAAIGVYGVMAYVVAQRTREIGVRMALGAARSDVVWLVMKEVLALAAIGIAIGLPAALALAKLAKSQLFGIQPYDALNVALATAAIAFIAALSGYIPARRATLVDPMLALRWE